VLTEDFGLIALTVEYESCNVMVSVSISNAISYLKAYAVAFLKKCNLPFLGLGILGSG